LARKVVPIDILATDIMLAHTGSATALVSSSAFEPGPVAVRALHRRLSALCLFAYRVPCTLRAFGLAALAAWCSACISAATTTIPLAWEIVPQDILAANIILAHAGVATALVACGALELVAIAVGALHRCLSALGVFADWVPCTLRPCRLAALAAWRIACISAAPAALSLARKVVPIDILAADIMLAHTGTAAALVTGSTFEPGSIVVRALHRRLSALCLFAYGVPCTLRPFGLAALAAWCSACVSAATTTIPLAWETVPQDILAANIILAHTGVATTLVA